jgi:guanylate kinase
LEQLHDKASSYKTFFGSTARLIVVAGASFSGKDDLVNAMIQIEPAKTLLYQKGTTRPKKDGDKGELLHLKELGDEYDVRYDKNGYTYGLSTHDIWQSLSQQKIVLIVLSDLDSIVKLKKEFHDICTVLYLHANINEEEMEKAKKDMSDDEFSKRLNSTKELRETYVKHMNVFNHVLLNTSESEDLYDQAFNILDFYLD